MRIWSWPMLKCAIEVSTIIISSIIISITIAITCVIRSWIVHLYALYGSMPQPLSLQGYNSPQYLFDALIIIIIIIINNIIIVIIFVIIIFIIKTCIALSCLLFLFHERMALKI